LKQARARQSTVTIESGFANDYRPSRAGSYGAVDEYGWDDMLLPVSGLLAATAAGVAYIILSPN